MFNVWEELKGNQEENDSEGRECDMTRQGLGEVICYELVLLRGQNESDRHMGA